MSNELLLTTKLLPTTTPDALEAYLGQINAIPLLTLEEEYELATRFQQSGDVLAAQKLVLPHLRFVVRIARNYSGYGLPLGDLIQEGTIGLMKAVKRFDPVMGVRLVSFAVHWIKSEIHDYVICNWRIVKVATTKSQRKLFFNLRKARKRLGWFSSEEIQAVALDLGVSPKDVMEMEQRLNAHDTTEEDAYYLPAPDSESLVENESKAALQNALEKLDARSLDIVSNRWLSDAKVSLKELAEKYHVSIERIRQLEKAAMNKLRSDVINFQSLVQSV